MQVARDDERDRVTFSGPLNNEWLDLKDVADASAIASIEQNITKHNDRIVLTVFADIFHESCKCIALHQRENLRCRMRFERQRSR